MGVFFQVLCTLIVCSLGANVGILFCWPASTLKLFASPNSPLNRPMTETEIALLGSLACIGALISNPASGLLIDWLGRKNCAIFNAMIVTVTWAILTSFNKVEAVLTGVFVSGLSSSVILVLTIYISEICQDSIRGGMAACSMVSYGVGILLSYLFGGYLNYHTYIYVGLTLSVAGTVLLTVLKETPLHLMSKGREAEAVQSLCYFRNLKPDSKEVMEELNKIKRALNPELDETTPEEEKLKPDLKAKKKLSWLQFIRKSRSTRRALITNLILVTASTFQGLVVIQMYAGPLFEEAIPTLSPALCSVIFAAIVVVSGLVAAYLTERAGRRPLMIYSSVGVGICCLVLGSQFHLHWAPNWLTAMFLYVCTTIFTFGAGTVPYVLVAELFLPEIKSYASMLVMEWTWVCNFSILFIFKPLMNLIGLGPVFYIFAVVCFFTAVFCVFFLPETKGLTVDAIQNLFIKKKKTPAVY